MSQTEASSSEPSLEPLSPALTEASSPYVGQWQKLVSTTNWEKGRIIHEWRTQLAEAEALPNAYADETWARLVGGVSGQHVGRLRRVWQRFGHDNAKYEGLYWSHFQAALDWEDAPMWLEGAVQSEWSVAQMRNQRWETMGAVAGDEPRAEDAVSGELDEDFEAAQRQEKSSSSISPEFGEIPSGATFEGPDFGDEELAAKATFEDDAETDAADSQNAAPAEPFRPFESLGDLPEDVQDAVEKFKLVILKHRRENWSELSQSDLVATLEALRQLALAPAEESAPF